MDWSERLTRRDRAAIGVISVLLATAGAAIAVEASFGAFDDGYELRATFAGAGQNLDEDSDVKIRGVNVGSVHSVELDERGRAIVTMQLRNGVQVPRTARAEVEPISVFGPKFVSIDPGADESDGPFLADGGEITDTKAPLELSDVLASTYHLLETIDPQELAVILDTFAAGADGLEDELGRSLTNGSTLLELAARRAPETQAFLRDLAAISAELADRGTTFTAAAGDLGEVLQVVGQRGDELASLLDATSRLSADLADVLDRNRQSIERGTRGGAAVVAAVHGQLRSLPGYIDSMRTYFGVLEEVIRVPVDGTDILMAAVAFYGPEDPCLLITLPGCGISQPEPGPGPGPGPLPTLPSIPTTLPSIPVPPLPGPGETTTTLLPLPGIN